MAGISYWGNKKDKGILLPIDNTTVTSVLKVLKENDTIINITLDVQAAFDATKTITIGTPADNNKFVKATDIDLTTVGVYEITQYYVASTVETLAIYISGASAGGSAILFIEMLQK